MSQTTASGAPLEGPESNQNGSGAVSMMMIVGIVGGVVIVLVAVFAVVLRYVLKEVRTAANANAYRQLDNEAVVMSGASIAVEVPSVYEDDNGSSTM